MVGVLQAAYTQCSQLEQRHNAALPHIYVRCMRTANGYLGPSLLYGYGYGVASNIGM